MGKGKNDEQQVDISQDMKSKVQPFQDNRDPMVKKLEKGATVTCYKCHGDGTSSTNALNLSRRWTRARRRS
jgi:predicted CxxxxCH...CXXCH cytochrome family protein